MKTTFHRIFLRVEKLQQFCLALMEDFSSFQRNFVSAGPFDLHDNPRQGRYYIPTSLCHPLPMPLLLFVYSCVKTKLPNKGTGEPAGQEMLVFIPRLESTCDCLGVFSQGHQIPQ